jgi:hypothetical protein
MEACLIRNAIIVRFNIQKQGTLFRQYYNRPTSCCSFLLPFSLVDPLRPVPAEVGRYMTSTRGNLRVVCTEASVPSPLISLVE